MPEKGDQKLRIISKLSPYPGETVAFTDNAYLDARELPLEPEIRWTYKVKQVYTR